MLDRLDPHLHPSTDVLVSRIVTLLDAHGVTTEQAKIVLALVWQAVKAGGLVVRPLTH